MRLCVKDIEKRNVLDKKFEADLRWEALIRQLDSGNAISRLDIVRCMDLCNKADWMCIQRNLLPRG